VSRSKYVMWYPREARSASHPHSWTGLVLPLETRGEGAHTSSARRIRGSHVGWDNAQDVADGHLILVHVVFALRRRDVA
jgi:hypothetical protein